MAANRKFTPRASTNLIEEDVKEETTYEAPEASVEEVTEPTDSVEEVIEPVTDVAPEEPKEETPNITFSPETKKKPIERMVKIRLAQKYRGCIGGEWYHFEKDQVVTVPENVKRILNSTEGMLKPL